MASFPSTMQVIVDTERFIQTRNALTSAYIGLSSSIDTAIKAYIAHTDVVLQGAGTFDISQLILPFQGAAGAAQVAEQAIQHGLIQVASQQVDVNGHVIVDPKKKEKRPYKPRDPNAPKRPLTAYFRYLREVRPFIAQEVAKTPNGEGTNKVGDISKIATERWKAMTEAQRKPYHEAYKGEMGAYEEATKAYKAEGGKLEDDAGSPDAELDSPSALPVNGVTPGVEEEDSGASSSEDDSSSEEESDEEEAAPAKLPTPPPVKTEKKTPKPKKIKAALDASTAVPSNNIAANHNIDPQLTNAAPVANMAAEASPVSTPFTALPLSQQPSASSKKRKAAEETPGTEKKKRGRPSKEVVANRDAAAAAQLHQPMPESSQAETASGIEKKKKKKRKSEAAGTV